VILGLETFWLLIIDIERLVLEIQKKNSILIELFERKFEHAFTKANFLMRAREREGRGQKECFSKK
jgi:hypothetical protein